MLHVRKRGMLFRRRSLEGRTLLSDRVQKSIFRKYSKCFWIIISICIYIFIFSMLLQHCTSYNMLVYSGIRNILETWKLWEYAIFVKQQMKQHLDMWSEFIVTYHTVVSAVIVFYFTIMDNRKEGVPHRRIVSYSFGSYTVPVLFFVSIFEVFIIFISRTLGWIKVAFGAILCAYMVQIFNIFVCLLSTSFRQTVHAICNIEIRQFKYLLRSDEQEGVLVRQRNVRTMSNEKWAFLMRHIENSIRSEDLMDDKMMMIQRLIRTPFYEKERLVRKLEMDLSGMFLLKPAKVYDYYYNNLLAAFNILSEKEHEEERLKFFVLLYDFITELSERYAELEKETYDYNKAKWEMYNYYITISAVMNAVLFSNIKESEAFCIHIFNNCILEPEMRNIQMHYYVMYQELLARTKIDAIELKGFQIYSEIYSVRGWKPIEEMSYEVFWYIWCESGSILLEESKRKYLHHALNTMFGGSRDSEAISYVMNKIYLSGENA